MKKPDIYLIKWFYAQSEDAWLLYNKDNNKISPMIIWTIGFIINENRKYIKVAASWGHNKNGTNIQYNGTMMIPKRAILNKVKI